MKGSDPESNRSSLCSFHPLIARWFVEKYGDPTDVQEQGWPRIANGEHVLITAPTGSGKTLTAFLWAINQLVTQQWRAGHISVLYVSPLRALNNDIYRNLLTPLSELKRVFEEADEFFPAIHVQTRSGDTPQSDRRRMLRRPPEILITTPESLNILLSSAGGISILGGILTVIMDEIHAVVDNKRGVHLITAVDRLVPYSGEFQRIALSATIRPSETVAEFVGGFICEGDRYNPRYKPRPVSVIRSTTPKHYDVRVRFPEETTHRQVKESVWEPLVDEFRRVIGQNRSTLLFVNSRRLCEKLTLKINDGETWPVAYAHHGSLSREIRGAVEHKLKAGELKAIVATNSLELGIDIGALDEVVLIQSPPSISSAIQRVGRAGHQVGQVSRGIIIPTHPHDFLEAAVLVSGILSQDIEAVNPIQCPLDVLSQIIVSMVGTGTWSIDELYRQLKASYPYRHLSREQLDMVLNMLAGRYAQSRIRELKPRVSIDRLDNNVTARKGALTAVYTSGGTIPDRGYFRLRHYQTNALIGELDEEFVWEASVGQTFALGTQNWRIERITHSDVFVSPGPSKAVSTPFWRGESNDRDFHFSMRIAGFLEFADEHLGDPALAPWLARNYQMDSTAAVQLITYLEEQKETTKCALPHRHHLLVEFVNAGPGSAPGNQVFLHTIWGGRVNRPFAMALDAAWEARFGHRLEIYAGNDCVVLTLPHQVQSEELLSLVTSTRVEPLLRERLESSGFFSARFRECAGRSLLLTRAKINERMPLWMSRLRSKKLLDAVLQYEDFPILLEAWRTCLQDEFDLESLKRVLTELENGSIKCSEVVTNYPSPMARNVSWSQINEYMYMGDGPASAKPSRLRGDLLRDMVYTPGLRPAVDRKLIEQFELKLKRLYLGYSPCTSGELLEWVKERLLVPSSEWDRLLDAVTEDHEVEASALIAPIEGKLARITPSRAQESLIAALENLPMITSAFFHVKEEVGVPPTPDFHKLAVADVDRTELLTSLLSEWLQFYGPTSVSFICHTLGIEQETLLPALEDLVESRKIVMGRLVLDGGEHDVCDSENFEILLRLSRAEKMRPFEPTDLEWLPLFLATYQGIGKSDEDIDGLYRRLTQLLCYSAEADMWESELLPVRLSHYELTWLDTIMQECDLRWVGSENRRVAFCFDSDLDLMQEESSGRGVLGGPAHSPDQRSGESYEPGSTIEDIFPDAKARYDFSTLLQVSGLNSSALGRRIWEAVWQGRVANDTFISIRRGIQNRFRIPDMAEMLAGPSRSHRRSGLRGSFLRWKSTIPFAGNWFRLAWPEVSDDLIEVEERNKDRVRILLDRYGILFRELLVRETPPFQWSSIFRSLRLMELSGEVLAGYFFHMIPGPQFISHQAFRLLQQKLPEDAVLWMNAVDPASLCGVELDALRGMLPKRMRHTHLVYRGRRLVLISERYGRRLAIRVPPDDPDLDRYLAPLRHLLTREFQPMHRITTETINGEEAFQSPYLEALRHAFEAVIDHKYVTLYRSGKSWGTPLTG